MHSESSKWNQNVLKFLVKNSCFLKYVYVYMYTKAFLLCLIKSWERTSKRKHGEIGKYKWNGSTEYEIEKVKQTR